MMRRLLLVCLAALITAWLPAAELDVETVSFSTRSKVGAVIVPPGLYRLKLQGAVVFFTDVNTKKSFSALVRIENGQKVELHCRSGLGPSRAGSRSTPSCYKAPTSNWCFEGFCTGTM